MTALASPIISENTANNSQDKCEAIIHFSGVSLCYGNQKALSEVSLDIAPGQVIALIGPNGAGKSTFVEIIMGLKKPAQGQVRVFGIDILKHPEKHLRRIGVQLQETKVFTKLTGRDYLEFFSRLYRHTLPVEDLIRQQDLQEFVDKPLGQVSGGQKQRIILALAIINDPDLIILDEPTIGLDPLARREFWSFIRKLQSSGKTLLFTTHYMDEVQALASQVIVLSRGKVVANGTPEQIIRLHNQSESSSLDDAYEVLVGQTQGAIA